MDNNKYRVDVSVDLGSVWVSVEVDAKDKESAMELAQNMVRECGNLAELEQTFGEVDSPDIDDVGYDQEAEDCVVEISEVNN
jgi:hypothetical protein